MTCRYVFIYVKVVKPANCHYIIPDICKIILLSLQKTSDETGTTPEKVTADLTVVNDETRASPEKVTYDQTGASPQKVTSDKEVCL